MQDRFDRDSGVTYIGPRSFVAGFAIVCGMFVAIVYGANRIMGSPESPLPISTTIGVAGVSTGVASALASPQPAAPNWLVLPQLAKPRSVASPQLAESRSVASPQLKRPRALVKPQLARPRALATPQLVRPRPLAMLQLAEPMSLALRLATLRPPARSLPARPVSKASGAGDAAAVKLPTRFAPVVRRKAAAAQRVVVSPQQRSSAIVLPMAPAHHRMPGRLPSAASVAPSSMGDRNVRPRAASRSPWPHSLRERIAVSSARPRMPKPPASTGPAMSDRASRSSPELLVPFKTATLTPNGALEPRLAGRAPLVISPAAKP